MDAIWWVVIVLTVLIGAGGVLYALWHGERGPSRGAGAGSESAAVDRSEPGSERR